MSGALAALLGTLRTHVYRAHHPRWSHAPTSGEGAALHGGRFNRPGVAALYTSCSPETAWLEAQQGFPFKAQPMTLCAYEVDCADVLDLGDETARRAAGIAAGTLGAAWESAVLDGEEPPTWTLADTLRDAGVAAVVVPSYASRAGARDRNVVFWRWGEDPPHRVAVIDDFGRLPRDDASWRVEPLT